MTVKCVVLVIVVFVLILVIAIGWAAAIMGSRDDDRNGRG